MFNFDPVSRDRMFYDKYEYGICIALEEAGCLRARTHRELDTNIAYRNRARSQWGGSSKHNEQIDKRRRDELFKMFDEIELVRDKIKMVISYGIIYVYSNDVPTLEHLAHLYYVKFSNAVQSIVDKPRDVILINNPKFKYRSYFKDKVLEPVDCERLLNFVETRKEIYGVTKTLKASLKRWHAHYLPRHLYVEHNDPKDITMLNLVVPGIIRKTMSVQAK